MSSSDGGSPDRTPTDPLPTDASVRLMLRRARSKNSVADADLGVLRRVAKGFGANAYDQAVTVLVQVVGVPILLHAWGATVYGEWLVLFAIPTYLSLTDLGLSQSAGNDMTARVVRGDRAGAARIYRSLAQQVYIGCAIVLALATALIWNVPLTHWLQLKAMSATSVRLTLWLAAAEMLVRLPNAVTDAGFRAGGDYPFHVALTSTFRLLQFAGVWTVALAGGSPAAATAAFFSVRVVATPFSAAVLHYRHRWLWSTEQTGWKELLPLIKPAMANLALPLAQALNIQGMVLVVGTLLGPIQVVVFSTLRTLTRLALQMVLAVSNSAEPEIAAAYGSGDRRLMHSIFRHVLSAGMWLAFLVAAGLTLFGSSIVRLWTHGSVQMNHALFALLLLSAVASVLWYGSLIVLKAANAHLQASVLFVATSAAAVAVSAVLLWSTGQVAMAGLTLLFMDAAMVGYTLRRVAMLLNVDAAKTVLQAADPTALFNAALSRVI